MSSASVATLNPHQMPRSKTIASLLRRGGRRFGLNSGKRTVRTTHLWTSLAATRNDDARDAPTTSTSSAPSEFANASLSQPQLDANAALGDRIRASKLVLAPLTRVGTLPFRRLCAELAQEASTSDNGRNNNSIVTVSEMAFARPLAKGDRVERTRLRMCDAEKPENGGCFGVQIATNAVSEGVRVAGLAAEAGASFVSVNAGCPIHEATRRGLGSALLRSPRKMSRLVAGIAEGSPIPIEVKIRLGVSDSSLNYRAMVPALVDAGAAAVTIHGRSGEGRYKKAASWEAIEGVATDLLDSSTTTPASASPRRLRPPPIVGNGDILTYFEAQRRLQTPGVSAVMIGRGALIRPWIFAEVREGREWLPSAEERVVHVYRRLVACYQDYLGADEKGEQKSRWFLPSSIDFLNRYRPLPFAVYGDFGKGDGDGENASLPLMSRRDDVADGTLGETLDDLSKLERLLRCADPDAHLAIAAELWRAESDADAVARLERVARESLEAWEERVRGGLDDDDGERRSKRSDDDDEGLVGGGDDRAPDDRDRGGKLGGAPGRGSMSRRRAKEQKEREKMRAEKEEQEEVVVV